MTIYAALNHYKDCKLVGSGTRATNTGGTDVGPGGFVAYHTRINGGTDGGTEGAIEIDLIGGTPTEVWFTCYLKKYSTPDAAKDMIVWKDGSTEFARLYHKDATDHWVFQTKTTSTWTDVQLIDQSTDFHTSDSSVIKTTIKLVVHDTTGEIAIYQEGKADIEYTSLDTTGDETITGVSSMILRAPCTGTTERLHVSEIIIADTDARTYRLAEVKPTAAGATSNFTGTYADIDDAHNAATWHTDFINTGTANDVSTFVAGNPPATSLIPLAVAVTGWARKDGTSPTNLQWAVRTGGTPTDYFSGNNALAAAFALVPANIWNTNPDTAAAWTTAEVDAMEIGVKAIA